MRPSVDGKVVVGRRLRHRRSSWRAQGIAHKATPEQPSPWPQWAQGGGTSGMADAACASFNGRVPHSPRTATLERPTLGSVRSFCAQRDAFVPYIHATSLLAQRAHTRNERGAERARGAVPFGATPDSFHCMFMILYSSQGICPRARAHIWSPDTRLHACRRGRDHCTLYCGSRSGPLHVTG